MAGTMILSLLRIVIWTKLCRALRIQTKPQRTTECQGIRVACRGFSREAPWLLPVLLLSFQTTMIKIANYMGLRNKTTWNKSRIEKFWAQKLKLNPNNLLKKLALITLWMDVGWPAHWHRVAIWPQIPVTGALKTNLSPLIRLRKYTNCRYWGTGLRKFKTTFYISRKMAIKMVWNNKHYHLVMKKQTKNIRAL